MKTIILLLILVLLIIIDKYDIKIRKEWNGIYIIWKTIKRDLISGEYYDIRESRRIYKL